MKILVISFYYPPDLSAGAFRMKALVEQLQGDDDSVSLDILTTQPSRFASYRPPSSEVGHREVNVTRLDIPKFMGGFKGEVISAVFFYFATRRLIKKRRYDVVLATSAKLMTGWVGLMAAKRTNAKFYLDVRDLFVENINDFFSSQLKRPMLPVVRWFEAQLFRRADRISITSPGFLPRIQQVRGTAEGIKVYTNGIDPQFIADPPELCFKHFADKPIEILYAGTIGRAQALEAVLPKLSKKLGDSYLIRVIGDGRKAFSLSENLANKGVKNVILEPVVSRCMLMDRYKTADILFIHLDDCNSLTKVIPSKIFEYAATGKPMICGVSGFPARFIEENIGNAAVFEPNNADDAFEQLAKLKLGFTDRTSFIQRYRRDIITKQFAEDIIILANSARNTEGHSID